jgi:hypothetical protein
MAWENRNGRYYYYRKRRVGRRGISEYLGASEFAELLARMDVLDQEEARSKWRAERLELARWLALDREITETLDLCSDLTSAALLIAGLHTHKGQWRRDSGRR